MIYVYHVCVEIVVHVVCGVNFSCFLVWCVSLRYGSYMFNVCVSMCVVCALSVVSA